MPWLYIVGSGILILAILTGVIALGYLKCKELSIGIDQSQLGRQQITQEYDAKARAFYVPESKLAQHKRISAELDKLAENRGQMIDQQKAVIDTIKRSVLGKFVQVIANYRMVEKILSRHVSLIKQHGVHFVIY